MFVQTVALDGGGLIMSAFVGVLTFQMVTSSRYLRECRIEPTLFALFPNNDSIKAFLEICEPESELPCAITNITDPKFLDLQKKHEVFLAEAKEKVLWTRTHQEDPWTTMISFIIFGLAFLGGLYLTAVRHLDCRQFGYEIVADGSFGFYLSILKSLDFRVKKISDKEYEEIIDKKFNPQSKSSLSASKQRRKKVKLMTREELLRLENGRRKLLMERRRLIHDEEELMDDQMRKTESQHQALKEEYFERLLDKYPQTKEPPAQDK